MKFEIRKLKLGYAFTRKGQLINNSGIASYALLLSCEMVININFFILLIIKLFKLY